MVLRARVRPEAMRIGIIAALPGELKPLVKGWQRVTTNTAGVKKWRLSRGGDTWIAVCAGMGADAARRAFAAAESDEAAGNLDMAISLGWAGALNAELLPGTAHVPTIVIDALTGEHFSLAKGDRKFRLVTTPHVADAAEKIRLASTYKGAVLVDMEAATLARLCEMHGIPLLCIKGVSDAVGANLPDLNPFIKPAGQMRMTPFLAYIAFKPQYWPSLIHLGRNSARAADAMRDLILKFMEEKNVDKLIATESI
jgi:adenosylhomocysteine nucleosidase